MDAGSHVRYLLCFQVRTTRKGYWALLIPLCRWRRLGTPPYSDKGGTRGLALGEYLTSCSLPGQLTAMGNST